MPWECPVRGFPGLGVPYLGGALPGGCLAQGVSSLGVAWPGAGATLPRGGALAWGMRCLEGVPPLLAAGAGWTLLCVSFLQHQSRLDLFLVVRGLRGIEFQWFIPGAIVDNTP